LDNFFINLFLIWFELLPSCINKLPSISSLSTSRLSWVELNEMHMFCQYIPFSLPQ